MPIKPTIQPFIVPPPCYGNCKDCPKHIHKIKNTECECCQSCKQWDSVAGAPGGHRFKKSKRKASVRKVSKRKVSKRKASVRKVSKRKL